MEHKINFFNLLIYINSQIMYKLSGVRKFTCLLFRFGVLGRNMLHGPWKEASAPVVNLHIDDDNVNTEAIAVSLAYLYGHHPKLNDNNAFRVLAAASFLDLQVLLN